MNKTTLFLIWMTLLGAFFAILYIFYLLVFPFKTIELVDYPMKIHPRELHRGDDISVTIHYIKYRDADIKTERQIECEDGNLVTLTSVERNFPLGENTITTNHLVLPDKVSDGECKLVYLVKYKVNAIRTILHRFETETFTVLPEVEK